MSKVSQSPKPTFLPSPPPHDLVPIVLDKMSKVVDNKMVRSHKAFLDSFITHVIAHHPVPGEPEWEHRASIQNVHPMTEQHKQQLYSLLVRMKEYESQEHPDPFHSTYQKGLFYHPLYVEQWVDYINQSFPSHLFPLSIVVISQ
jgi:hypothetical protein